jgi:undecaprenyl-diphosphatase
LEATTQPAFPSGHAGATTAIVVTLLLLAAPQRRVRWWMAGGAFVVAMGLSRVYLRVHWLSDVAMGSLVGAAAAVLAVGSVALLAGRRARPRDVQLRGRDVGRS